jgi:hypothetical protein
MAVSAPVAWQRVPPMLAASETRLGALLVAISTDEDSQPAADGYLELASARCLAERMDSRWEPHHRQSTRSSTVGISDTGRTCQ